MSIISPPKNYNQEDLYLYVELLSYTDNGAPGIDFTGGKTYNVGFMKEGIGFGITNISVDISPSMQPIVEITFKDLYGNLAMEFDRNKDFLKQISEGTTNIEELNYSSMFDLPYPKFKLVLKGYIGKPAALELNVKRIDVTYQPNDGSYEIKALFIPNLYGFFADMPFYFLKAVKHLRLKGKPNADNNRQYQSIFDLIEVGLKLQQQRQFANKSIDTIKSRLTQLDDLSESVLGDDFDLFKPISNLDSNGVKIKNMKEIHINVKPGTSQNSFINLQGTGENAKKAKRDLLAGNKNDVVLKKIIASLSEGSATTAKTDLFADKINEQNYQRGKLILSRALAEVEEYSKEQYVTGNQDLIKQVTIKSVFDLLVKDSSYLLGCILAAGRAGFLADTGRSNAKGEVIGMYFPLTQSPDSNEQIPYATNGPEAKFVNDFTRALTEGLIEEQRKELDKSASLPDDTETQLKKRITNLELGNQNPYATVITGGQLLENLIIRTGLAGHFFMDSFPIIDSLSDDDDVNDMVSSELENLNVGLRKLEQIHLEEISTFCKFITAEIDIDGKFTDEDFDENKNKMNKIISYINSNSKIDKKSLRATKLFHNGLYYIYPGVSSNDYYVLFNASDFRNNTITQSAVKDSEGGDVSLSSVVSSLLTPDGDNTRPFSSPDNQYEIQYVTTDNVADVNSIIDDERMLRFNTMQINLSSNEDDISSMLQTTELSDTADVNKTYFYATYQLNDRNSGYVWDFLSDTDEAFAQRYILRSVCKRILGLIESNKKESDKKIIEVRDKFRQQDTFKIFYTQFHHLCNNWKNLIKSDSPDENTLIEEVTKRFSTDDKANIIYEIPLQQVQAIKPGELRIKPENAIVNIKPLQDNNSQSTVLSVMSNMCNMNNFMFLAIPGLGDEDNKSILSETLGDMFNPYTTKILPDSIKAGNLFYVIWMPTPENRVKFNNGDSVYVPFNPDLQKDVFEINFGSTDNTVFKSVNLTTEDNKVTSESAIAINTIADSQNSNKYKNYDCSALSVMEGRSYKISCDMLGCAQVKPTQFFVLNSTKVFTGLYQIMRVKHKISPQEMTTSFEAIKMKYSGKNSFVYVPPVTLETLGINQPETNNQSEDTAQSTPAIASESGGFTITESSLRNYLGTITHPTINIAEKALLDTISYMDNGAMTDNFGYDVLVGHKNSNPRLIEGWSPSYNKGHDFNAWKLFIQSPTLGQGVYSSAAGRYQIVNTTWKGVIKNQNNIPWTGTIIDPLNVPFNKDNQDLCASSLLNSRLRTNGLNTGDIEDAAVKDYDKFVKIMRSLKKEWESIELLFVRGSWKSMSTKEYYDFFVEAYNIYKNKA